MWSSSSSGGEDNIINQRKNNSRASSSSSSPFSPSSLLPAPRRKTMEDVWKDISLASLHDHDHDHPTREELPRNNTLNTFKGMIPQDFLARPFSKDPPTIVASREISLFGSPTPPPATVLSLNSGPDFHCLDSTDPQSRFSQFNSHGSTATASYISSLNAPFDAFASSSGLASFCKKRVPENDGNTGDRRHKRMIKNRESAARSRARKQECYSHYFFL
ncbi:hypothetical protein HHK36_010342 [Tetracentron sinense]|uniref:BZIP domain-containing protein n=1 Tax=Tetracentron sinense TaxID=13715 RepID=A0A835DJ55_TETSI|nr:hypothetical protein HHK36_010342 [Tetracentron sinense]